MIDRGIPLVLGTAAGALLFTGVIPLATSPAAQAGCTWEAVVQACDIGLASSTQEFGPLTTTMDAAPATTVDPDAAFASAVFDPDFVSNTHDFGLFTLIDAADPSDGYVAVVFQSSLFTDILTSGADPEGNLGFGDAGIGVDGETVNTFISSVFPDLNSTFSLPFEDPFADLFTWLVQLGL